MTRKRKSNYPDEHRITQTVILRCPKPGCGFKLGSIKHAFIDGLVDFHPESDHETGQGVPITLEHSQGPRSPTISDEDLEEILSAGPSHTNTFADPPPAWSPGVRPTFENLHEYLIRWICPACARRGLIDWRRGQRLPADRLKPVLKRMHDHGPEVLRVQADATRLAEAARVPT